MLPVLTAEQIRHADSFTIAQEPIRSIDLMERAALACYHRFMSDMARSAFPAMWANAGHQVSVVAGMGNNGGDGLALARLLHLAAIPVRVLLLRHTDHPSPDAGGNLERAQACGVAIEELSPGASLPRLMEGELVVDAIFGTGLDRPVEGWLAEVVNAINAAQAHVIAIDLPTGVQADGRPPERGEAIVRAARTYTFQYPKRALLLAESAPYAGQWDVLPIGLLPTTGPDHPEHLFTLADARAALPDRPAQAHKGRFGHCLVIAGQPGMAGAAVLATKAALRSGAGLVTAQVPAACRQVLQTAVPEAMVASSDDEDMGMQHDDNQRYDSVAIGPGLGMAASSAALLKKLIQEVRAPLVIDADGLNLLAENRTWMSFLPVGTVLTPHPGEFDRLAGGAKNGAERLEQAKEMARRLNVVIILKGGPAVVLLPDGRSIWNSTGNAGMAKGGSGDALTGLVAGLLAMGMDPAKAATLGMYVHGLAGDIAARQHGQDGMTAMDLVDALSAAWQLLRGSAQHGNAASALTQDHRLAFR